MLGQGLGVGQPQMFLGQGLLFVRLEPGGPDLLKLELEHVDPPGALAGMGGDVVDVLARLAQRGDFVGDRFAQFPTPGIGVQQVHVFAHPQQRQMLALAMGVDEQLAELAQDRLADRPAVDPAQRPAV